MTVAQGWWGPALDADQGELRSMLDGFIAAHPEPLSDDPTAVAALVAEIAGLGVWTLGTPEAVGGGGADPTMTALALERLGRGWPALGWAAVQAHAAVEALTGQQQCAALVERLHNGAAAVAVVDARASHVHLDDAEGVVTGTVERVDVAAERPHLLVLTGPDTAVLVEPTAMLSEPLRRTGFSGALTRSLQIQADADSTQRLIGLDNAGVQVRLWTGAAAVATGIAGAAADTAAEYSEQRHQFGGPLSAIPTVRQQLLTQRSRSIAILFAAIGGAREPVAAYSAMTAACDGAIDIAASALQSLGGYGYLTEYPTERYLRDAVSLRAAADTWSAAATVAAQAGASGHRSTPWQEAK